MRNLITISFLTVYLFGNTELGQLVNLPLLVKHFHQHHQINKKVSFLDFLAMHYCGDDGTTADDNEDNQLPFKQLHQPFSIIPFEVPFYTSFNSNIIFSIPEMVVLFKNDYPKSGYLLKLLRPPQLSA